MTSRKIKQVFFTAVIPLILLALATIGLWHLFPHIPWLFNESERRPFIVSVISNVFVFLFVGLAGIIYKRFPEEDSLEQRLGYLFPNLGPNDGYHEEVQRQVKQKLSAFGEKAELQIEIREYDNQIDAVKLFIKFDITYRNILVREEHRDKDFGFEVAADPVSRSVRGSLQDAQWICGGKITSYPGCTSIEIAETDTSVSRKVDFRIPPNDCVQIIHSCWVWAQRGVPYKQAVNRFVENIQVVLTNNTNENLRLKSTSDHFGAVGQIIELRGGENKRFSVDCILPDAGFELAFKMT